MTTADMIKELCEQMNIEQSYGVCFVFTTMIILLNLLHLSTKWVYNIISVNLEMLYDYSRND